MISHRRSDSSSEKPRIVPHGPLRLSNNLAKPFFDEDSITIYNHDFIASSPLPPKSIDLIVTSPPYNVDISYGQYDDKLPYEKYKEFSRAWLKRCYSLAKVEGRLCVNVALDKNKGGHQSIYADI